MVFCEMFWVPFESLVGKAFLGVIQVIIIKIGPFSQSVLREIHEREQWGKKSALAVLTPLFHYLGLIILIIVGKVR